MKRANIYKYSDGLVFIPNGFLEKGPIISIEPIVHMNILASNEELGETLLQTINCSKKVTLSLEESTQVFKKLLQISKAKSNKKLVQYGQLVSAHLNEDLIQLELLESNIKYKGFIPKKERQIIKIKLHQLNNTDLGKKIKELFGI